MNDTMHTGIAAQALPCVPAMRSTEDLVRAGLLVRAADLPAHERGVSIAGLPKHLRPGFVPPADPRLAIPDHSLSEFHGLGRCRCLSAE